MKKLAYLESLRGLAALVVVFGHFVVGFYPALYFGSTYPVHTKQGTEVFISGTPLNLFYNGTFSVSIFFVLSGFVLTCKFFKDRSAPVHLIPLIAKRYVRLFPPVVFSILFSYLLIRFSLLYNQPASAITRSSWLAGYLNFEPNILTALYESFIGVFFKKQASYNGVLWTMTFEFYGSVLVYLFAAIFGNWKRRYFAYIIALLLSYRSHYAAFVAGMLLSDVFMFRPDLFGKKRYAPVYITLFMIGLFLGSYPAGRPVEGTLYEFMKPYATVRSYNILGASLVMLSLLNLPGLQAFLSRKAFVFLGKISFSQYILHFLLAGSLGCFVFVSVAPHVSYHMAFLIMFLTTMPVIVLASFATYTFVDSPGVGFSQRIYKHAVDLGKRYGHIPRRIIPLSVRSNPLYRTLFQYETAPHGSKPETGVRP